LSPGARGRGFLLSGDMRLRMTMQRREQWCAKANALRAAQLVEEQQHETLAGRIS
jgi:hypothetical protein